MMRNDFDHILTSNQVYKVPPTTNPSANSRQLVNNSAFVPIYRPTSELESPAYQPYKPQKPNQFNDQPSYPQTQFINSRSLNNKAPHYVSQKGYVPIRYRPNAQDLADQTPCNWRSPMTTFMARTRLNQHAYRFFLYLFVFILQIPFVICDLYFSLAEPESECMDSIHKESSLVLRPWLLVMGICQAYFMAIFLLLSLCRTCKLINIECLITFEMVNLILLMIKNIIWTLSQQALFKQNMISFCSDGVYEYGSLLLIVQPLLTAAVFGLYPQISKQLK